MINTGRPLPAATAHAALQSSELTLSAVCRIALDRHADRLRAD
jgi:hypothetical protein